MGASYANIFVLDTSGRKGALEAVAAAIRATVLDDPSTTEVQHGLADRTITVAALTGERWIGVFDELADTLEVDVLVGLGVGLSVALHATVVATAVIHSDLAMAWLIDGEVIDQMARPFNVLDEMTEGETDGWDGDAERWATLIPGTDTTALRAAWETDDVFAEERLAAAADVLAIPRTWAYSGQRYLEDSRNPGKLIELRFRVNTPATPPGPPARLQLGSSPGYDRSPVGEPPADLEVMTVLLRPGDAFGPRVMGQVPLTGELIVVIDGEAMTDGLVVVDRLQVGTFTDRLTVNLVDGRNGSTAVRFARFARPPIATGGGPFAEMLMINLEGRATKVGAGRLQVTVGGSADFIESQKTVEFDVRVEIGAGRQSGRRRQH
jgi:hypothetical protein